jgi:hypothetical protein
VGCDTFDYILIYTGSKEEHYSYLRYIFQKLQGNHFHVKASMCVFGVLEISFLGHKISCTGFAPEIDKIETIQQWPQPSSFTTLRAVLGLTGYYHRFVQGCARIATPLAPIDVHNYTYFAQQFYPVYDCFLENPIRICALLV